LYLYTKETTSKDIDESYRNITFQLYHIKCGFSTLFGRNRLKRPAQNKIYRRWQKKNTGFKSWEQFRKV